MCLGLYDDVGSERARHECRLMLQVNSRMIDDVTGEGTKRDDALMCIEREGPKDLSGLRGVYRAKPNHLSHLFGITLFFFLFLRSSFFFFTSG